MAATKPEATDVTYHGGPLDGQAGIADGNGPALKTHIGDALYELKGGAKTGWRYEYVYPEKETKP